MASQDTLANPTVEINDTVVAVQPNTVSYKTGRGNKNQRSQSAGGDSIQIVTTVDAETKKGMVKLSLVTTKTAVELIKEWQDALSGVTIRLSQNSFVESFRQMEVIEDPEIGTGADGSTEINFEGLPAV